MRIVLKEIKLNEAAGFDGVYSEFFKHNGHKMQAWLATFCSLKHGVFVEVIQKDKNHCSP